MKAATRPTIDGLSDAKALQLIGLLIDSASDARSVQDTEHSFTLLDQITRRKLSPKLIPLVHYFRANAWANREQLQSNPNVWAWEQPECQEQILELQRAVRYDVFAELPTLRQCQILTNLANQLNKIGRFIDAVEFYDHALSLNSKFGMAHGNRGIALSHYARALYDDGHTAFMLAVACDSLKAAIANDAFYEGLGYAPAQEAFRERAKHIAVRMDVSAPRKLRSKKYSAGRSAAERRYRNWCLHNRLFINPLNDLGVLSIAAHDVLTLPSLTVSVAERAAVPGVIGFFNQMKQEFVSARLLYYEGTTSTRAHFSDRGVLLYNTLDYPAYSLAIEKTRAAFRLVYSLFDKISFFINHYLQLGHDPNRVSFRSVWYEAKGKMPRPLLTPLAACQNWPLRGLFWLSKDLFEGEFRSVTEPDAESLNEIRNHLEHKYLQIHQEIVPLDSHALGHSIYRDDFADKTLRLLKLARASLIYLSLAVWSEERRGHQSRPRKAVVSLPLDIWCDEWKH